MNKEVEICKICGSRKYDSYLKFKGKDREIVICKDCKTFRSSPYFVMDYRKQELYCEHYLKNEEFFRGFAKALLNVVTKHKQRGRFLDIGCSVGFMLEEAQKLGFNSEGIELNEEAVRIAKSKGFKVIKSTLEDAKYEENIFDVIMLNHVLEHILEPNEFMQNIKQLLKKDGILVIGVPNHDALMTRLYRESWYGWGIPEHIWHFNRKTLSYLLSRNNINILELIQNGMHYLFSKSLRKNTRAVIAGIGSFIRMGDQLIAVAGR